MKCREFALVKVDSDTARFSISLRREAGDGVTKLSDLKEQLMQDPVFRTEYEKIDEQYELVEVLVCARKSANLTQSELAERLGTTQSAIARMEGARVSPSIATLRRYAKATGNRLKVEFVPLKR